MVVVTEDSMAALVGKTSELSLGDLPAIALAPPADKPMLFRQKLKLCCKVYDFNSTKKHVREKEAKKEALLEMVEYIGSDKNCFSDGVIPEFMAMIAANLFRGLTSKKMVSAHGTEDDDEPVLEPSWCHLQIVYELLLRFVVSKEVHAKSAKQYFAKDFLVKLIDLFDSEDPRERDYLKTILHRIYGKSMALRAFIRRAINNQFYTFVYETESFNGIGELLEILGSIINGFALPLKQEHQRFLKSALIPLHKVGSVQTYHQQLSYCVTQFVEKDSKTAEVVILGLLRYWPVTASTKEILFLNELEEVLELTQPEEFAAVKVPLFTHICKTMCSPHFQVAQRALYMWNNEYIVNLVAQNRHDILPLIFGPLYRNCDVHWHAMVQTLTYNVLKLFMEMDSELFDQCSAELNQKEGKTKQTLEEKKKAWESLEKNSPSPDTSISS